MSVMFFHVLWIVFAFGHMSRSLSCFVVSLPKLYSVMSVMFFHVLWIVFAFGHMSRSLSCFVVSLPKLYSVTNLVACLKIDFLPFMILFISSVRASLILLSVELLR